MKLTAILVPTDFSPCADNATKYAIAIAKQFGAKVILLNVFTVNVRGDTATIVDTSIIEEAGRKVICQFEALKIRVPSILEVAHEFKSEFGNVVDEVATYTKKNKIDLILAGTKGKTNRLEEFFGSNAYDFIKHIELPILVIPENITEPCIGKIAFATDFKGIQPSKTINILRNFAEAFNSEVHIIHVHEPPFYEKVEVAPTEVLSIAKKLKGIKHQYTIFDFESAEKGITHYVEYNGISLLTLLKKKHSSLDLLFKGSITKKMAHHSKIPLLIL